MKLAIFHNILWSKYKGGVFSALYRLAAAEGVQPTFVQIAETESDRVALGGVDMAYHTYPFELLFKGSYYATPASLRVRTLMKQAWRTDADLVILPGYERAEYWAMLFVLAVRGKKRAVFCDSTAYDRPRSWHKTLAKRLFFAMCHGFFGYGTRSKEYLEMHGVPSEEIHFRCQAAALPMSYTEAGAMEQRARLAPRPEDTPRFLYVGRLSVEKGLLVLLQAVKLLQQQAPGGTLRLVGAGPMQAELQAAAQHLGISQHVQFAGSMGVEALALEYASASALVLASTSEPWGLVVNEALSMGCPVVVSERCGCVPELVVRGQTGLVFKAGDAEELAACMRQMPLDYGNTETTARRCIEHMRQFSPDAAALQILTGAFGIVRGSKVA